MFPCRVGLGFFLFFFVFIFEQRPRFWQRRTARAVGSVRRPEVGVAGVCSRVELRPPARWVLLLFAPRMGALLR